MKKLSYLIISLFVSLTVSAQSYWGEGFEANFDKWIDIVDDEGNVTGQRPWGWHAPWNSNWELGSNTAGVKFFPVEDRFGEENKACKIETTGILSDWFTWHVGATLAHWSTMEDYNPIFIDQGDDFYYTFWAKSDEEGTVMWIGAGQNYDPSHGKIGWDKVPNIELTTGWKKYAVEDFAVIDLTGFDIQLRNNGIRYIDDIALEYGELPSDWDDDYKTGIVEIASDNTPLTILASRDGIGFSCLDGVVSVYDLMGNQIVSDQQLSEGGHFIPVPTKGLHIIKFVKDGKETVAKAMVR